MDLQELFPNPPVCALFLDDCRIPHPNHYFNWVVVRSYQEFINYIRQQGMPDFISFDHDLGPQATKAGADCNFSTDFPYHECLEKTGYDAAKWLVEYCLDNKMQLPHCTVHSANAGGTANILGLLNNLRKHQGNPPDAYRTYW